MFLLFLTHKYLQYKSKAPKPQKASIYILSSYSQWAPLSNVPNFCGFWPKSFCGSAAITSNPNLETKWFLLLTHRARDPAMAAPIAGTGGSPSRMGTAGVPRRCQGAQTPRRKHDPSSRMLLLAADQPRSPGGVPSPPFTGLQPRRWPQG